MGKKGQGATKHDPMQSGDGLLPADAITADHFNELMTACLPDGAGGDVAVAVSGGADSMALCLLAQGWAKAQGVRLFALTVDHGLRADAAAEARQVGQWLSGHDIEHHVLGHEDPPPRANIQAWARELRYRLMEDWCAQHGVPLLLVAHHLEDQAETLLLRLARGSGVDGLAAMAEAVPPAFDVRL